MTIETISGTCPICSYDKMLMVYGTGDWTHIEGCPNCGFGYADNAGNDSPPPEVCGFDCWRGWAEEQMTTELTKMIPANGKPVSESARAVAKAYISDWSNETLRRILFGWMETQERKNDVATTLFAYDTSDLEKFKATNPIIFKQIS